MASNWLDITAAMVTHNQCDGLCVSLANLLSIISSILSTVKNHESDMFSFMTTEAGACLTISMRYVCSTLGEVSLISIQLCPYLLMQGTSNHLVLLPFKTSASHPVSCSLQSASVCLFSLIWKDFRQNLIHGTRWVIIGNFPFIRLNDRLIGSASEQW